MALTKSSFSDLVSYYNVVMAVDGSSMSHLDADCGFSYLLFCPPPPTPFLSPKSKNVFAAMDK